MKHCSNCKTTKPVDNFSGLKSSKDGLQPICKVCHNAKMKAYYQANPDRIKARANIYFAANRDEQNRKRRERRLANLEKERETGRQWSSKNQDKTRAYKSKYNAKRRAMLFDQSIPTQDIQKLVKAQSCYYCSKSAKLTIDHVVPLSRGGLHTLGNLVMACSSCNSSKGGKLLIEWKQYLKRISN